MPISREAFEGIQGDAGINHIDWVKTIEALKGHAWTAREVADIAAKNSTKGVADLTRVHQKLKDLVENGTCIRKYVKTMTGKAMRNMHYYYFP